MSDKERLVRFRLFGQDFTFYTGASEEEMDEILNFLRSMVEDETPGLPGTLPASKVAVMACLNLASKFMKLNKDFEIYKLEMEQRISNLYNKFEDLLAQEKHI
jgi:hypothetical protein